MRRLYHGTRYLPSILAAQKLRCAPVGDTHVSLTTKKAEARYWAELYRDDVTSCGYILTLDGDKLRSDGFTLTPYHSPFASRDEREIACLEDIDNVLRYIVAIEKVPGTEVVVH